VVEEEARRLLNEEIVERLSGESKGVM